MNKIIVTKIDDIDMNCLGIAHYNNKTIFIDNALPNEEVKCEIIKEKNNICYAKNLEILKYEKNRVIPLCKYFNICGGCDIQHLSYEETLKFKKNQIKLSFKKIAKTELKDFEIIGSKNEYFYRNKISMPIREINGKKVLCLYKKSSHEAIKITSCKIMNEKFDDVINFVNDYLNICNLSTFNEKTNSGILKHLVCRIIEDNILLTFVLQKKANLNDIEILYKNLKTKFNKVGININININKNSKEILSHNFIDVIGDNTITFKDFNIITPINNASFLQVNLDIQNKLYNYILNNVSGNIVNAYSGAGLLSSIIAKNNSSYNIFGIEINKHATKLADELKLKNNIKNLKNICGDAGKILQELQLTNYSLIVDPARSGLDNNMILAIKQNLPDKIIYVSCNRINLAKNLRELLPFYNLSEVKAFDMFPQTKEVETVVILEKSI